jgi:hypothetical protein
MLFSILRSRLNHYHLLIALAREPCRCKEASFRDPVPHVLCKACEVACPAAINSVFHSGIQDWDTSLISKLWSTRGYAFRLYFSLHVTLQSARNHFYLPSHKCGFCRRRKWNAILCFKIVRHAPQCLAVLPSLYHRLETLGCAGAILYEVC